MSANMRISPVIQGDGFKLAVNKVWDEERHILCLGVLPFQAQSDGTSGTSSWKPVKDLARACMLTASGDEPRVDICDRYDDQFLPWAFVNFKKEENARRVFDQIAGNTWHGSVLTAIWFFFSPEPQELHLLRIGSELDRPEALETRSQIRDKKLLRRGPLTNSKRSKESPLNNVLKIAMTIISNLTSSKVSLHGHPICDQMRMSNPVYHAAIPQPWSSVGVGNQTHTAHNAYHFDRAHGQWMIPTPDPMLDPISNHSMTGSIVTTSAYPMPPVVMSPTGPVLPNNKHAATKPKHLNTNLNMSNSQTQPTKGTHQPITKSAAHGGGAKTASDGTKNSRTITYSPPVIVDGSKSTSLM